MRGPLKKLNFLNDMIKEESNIQGNHWGKGKSLQLEKAYKVSGAAGPVNNEVRHVTNQVSIARSTQRRNGPVNRGHIIIPHTFCFEMWTYCTNPGLFWIRGQTDNRPDWKLGNLNFFRFRTFRDELGAARSEIVELYVLLKPVEDEGTSAYLSSKISMNEIFFTQPRTIRKHYYNLERGADSLKTPQSELVKCLEANTGMEVCKEETQRLQWHR
ncbi:hypothetical protein AKJ16_DCAP08782 [Drosera capensis]